MRFSLGSSVLEGMTVKETRKSSAAARAEAAAWVARLHGPNRTPEVEAGLRRWLADDPEHAAAFERLTDTWERSAQLRRPAGDAARRQSRPAFSPRLVRTALAAAAVACFAVVGALLFLHNQVVTTGIAEFRTLTLDDGSRLYLNTNTRVRVHFDDEARRITLEQGEALFDVAKRPTWPFIVSVGGREIRALGTSFDVRHDQRDIVVTLVEGKVAVGPKQAKEPIVLSPGERLTLAQANAPQIDRPPINHVLAWRRGQVVFDDTPLVEAVAEMNRYSRRLIRIDDADAHRIRVSGIFNAGDSLSFAEAVGRAYRLVVRFEDPERIILASSNR